MKFKVHFKYFYGVLLTKFEWIISITYIRPANIVIHQSPCSEVACFCFVFGVDVRTYGLTPCVTLMITYWPEPGGSISLAAGHNVRPERNFVPSGPGLKGIIIFTHSIRPSKKQNMLWPGDLLPICSTCWPTRPQSNRWSLFSHMASVRPSEKQKSSTTLTSRPCKQNTRYNWHNNENLLALAWWVILNLPDLS